MATEQNAKNEYARLAHLSGLEYEMVRATTAFEHAALRPLLLLNGGALGALFALYGSMADSAAQLGYAAVMTAAALWWLGLIAAAIATFFGAWSQFAFRKLRGAQVQQQEQKLALETGRSVDELNCDIKTYTRDGNFRRYVAIGFGIASMALFVIGMVPAFLSIPRV